MISVAELDNIARARIEDAKVLLTAGRYDGATYLCGYAVEVALKARICRTLNWTEFPSTGSEFQAYRSFHPRTRCPAAPFGAGGADQAEPLLAMERRGHLEGRVAIQCCRHGAAT